MRLKLLGWLFLLIFSAEALSPSKSFSKHKEDLYIVINIPALTLSLLKKGKVIKKYPIAVGKPSTPTPVGRFKVISKIQNPTYFPLDGGEPIPPGPRNPVGKRWIGIGPSLGIHGTNNPSSIGRVISHGCIRLYEKDIEELFYLIKIGTPVYIKYKLIEVEAKGDKDIFVHVYSDIYGRGKRYLSSIKKELKNYGLNWSNHKILSLIKPEYKTVYLKKESHIPSYEYDDLDQWLEDLPPEPDSLEDDLFYTNIFDYEEPESLTEPEDMFNFSNYKEFRPQSLMEDNYE